MSEKTVITITGIIAITLLEIIAMLKGLDGQIFATVISILAGLCGYTLGKGVRNIETQ